MKTSNRIFGLALVFITLPMVANASRDPNDGIFLGRDSIGGGGLNLYAYCLNNPIRYVDPLGLEAVVTYTGGQQSVLNSAPSLVNEIQNAPDGSISNIDLIGHGNPEGQSFGDNGAVVQLFPNGQVNVGDRGDGQGRDLGSFPDLVRPKLAPNGGVYYNGCDTGRHSGHPKHDPQNERTGKPNIVDATAPQLPGHPISGNSQGVSRIPGTNTTVPLPY